jgi:hypothetical protein
MILYEELQREMGLNLEKEDGFASFGIKVKKYDFVVLHNLQEC